MGFWGQITRLFSFAGWQMERNCAPGVVLNRLHPGPSFETVHDLDNEILTMCWCSMGWHSWELCGMCVCEGISQVRMNHWGQMVDCDRQMPASYCPHPIVLSWVWEGTMTSRECGRELWLASNQYNTQKWWAVTLLLCYIREDSILAEQNERFSLLAWWCKQSCWARPCGKGTAGDL